MPITIDLILAACAGVLTVSAAVGLAVRFILLPYLREHIARPVARLEAPVAETRDHVANDHATNLREDVDELDRKLDRVLIELAEMRATSKANRRADAQVLRASEQTHRDLWSAIRRRHEP